MTEIRSETKRQRWTPTEWAEIERRARVAGVTPSDYVRWAALRVCSGCGRALDQVERVWCPRCES